MDNTLELEKCSDEYLLTLYDIINKHLKYLNDSIIEIADEEEVEEEKESE
ncbi:MAG: hypothetical protein IJI22_03630 [Bacilli bacterium]|nr:hypothetical protein [Bacilli bacterium]